MEPQQEKVQLQLSLKLKSGFFLILLGMIPVINLVAYVYFSFNRKINPNQRNFARAALIYLIIIIVLATLTTILL